MNANEIPDEWDTVLIIAAAITIVFSSIIPLTYVHSKSIR